MSATARAVSSDRRAPQLAAVEWGYGVFRIVRDLSFLTWWERWTFDNLYLPLARYGFRHWHWPIYERLDRLRCEACGHDNVIENGGCWTEKEEIVTTRELAIEACKSPDYYFHRLRVNAVPADATLRTHNDHDFPRSPGHRGYQSICDDVGHVSMAELESLAHQVRTVNQRAS